MVALDVAVVVVVALLAVLVAGLLRSHAEILQALHQLGADLSPGGGRRAGAGATTPVAMATPGRRPTPGRPDAGDVFNLAGATPSGGAVTIAVRDVGHDTLLAFLTSGCTTCRAIWDALRAAAAGGPGGPGVPGGARLVAVTRGPEAESPGALAGLADPSLPVVMSTEAWEGYDVPHAPYFIYVSGSQGRVVGEGTAATWEEVRQLLSTAAADAAMEVAGDRAAMGAVEEGAAMGAVEEGAALGAVEEGAAMGTAGRGQRIDQELSAAGIHPGDPRLHPTSLRGDGGG